MQQLITVSESATRLVENFRARGTFFDRLIFTGNVLVKSFFEDALIPENPSPAILFMYCGLEYTKFGNLACKIITDLTRPEGQFLETARLVAINKAAQEQSLPITIYGPDGLARQA